MRILIDVRLLSRGGSSGIEEYTKLLVSHLLELGNPKHTFELFYNGWKKVPLPKEWLNNDQVVISEWRWPNKLFDLSSRFFGRPKIDLHLNPNVIFSPHFNILSHSSYIPRVMTIHDLSFLHHPYFFSFRHRLWHSLQDVKKQVARSKFIITDSDFTKSDLIDTFRVHEDKIKRIYPGIDPRFKKIMPDEEILKKYNIKRPYILSLGTLEPRKNTLGVIEAFEIIKSNSKRYKDLSLVVAGYPGWLFDEITKAISRSTYASSIHLIGGVGSADRVHIYNAAEVFVYPSFFEGFGFPPLEAQACGVPTVTSNRTSLPEILGDSAVLVDPWRVGDLACAILEILNSTSWSRHLIDAGFKNIKRFSWVTAARNTLHILESINR